MGIEHFDSIAAVLDRLRRNTPRNPLGTDSAADQYEWIDWGDEDGGRIMPSLNSPFASPFLYRGQNRRYSPCLPALYRGSPLVRHPQQLPPANRDAYLLAKMQFEEFNCVVQRHPAVGFAREVGLHLSRVALAQHYGIPTDHLDLTQDPDIAAFFAVNAVDGDGLWRPEKVGIGVLYRFDLTAFPAILGDVDTPDLFRRVEMIGLQTLPRPAEQKAWTFRLPLGFDFDSLPLDVFTFDQTEKGGQLLYQKFDGGQSLFPQDVLADVAESILKSRTVSQKVARKVLIDHDCKVEMLEKALDTYTVRFQEGFNVRIVDREEFSLSPEQMCVAQGRVDSKRTDFLRNVGVRAIKPANQGTHEQRSA